MHPGDKYDLAIRETKRLLEAADPDDRYDVGIPRLPYAYDPEVGELARRLLRGEDMAEVLRGWWGDSVGARLIEGIVNLQRRLLA